MKGYLSCAIFALASSIVSLPAKAETLTNETVVTLVKAGLGNEAVIAKIRGSASQFDLSTDQMIALKQQGVSGPVIAAMIESGALPAKPTISVDSPDPTVLHPPGIYLLGKWLPEPKMVRIDPTGSNQTKTGGILGYALTGGIASVSMKAAIPNASARIQSREAKPTFYFYFDEAGRAAGQTVGGSFWQGGAISTATTPSEFSLVRFMVKKDRREARVGSMNIAGAKSGVMDKDRIPFTYDLIAPGVFKVSPSADLPPGEYGFLASAQSGSGPGMYAGGVTVARVFDFAVLK
jgi:hypothetical protein